MLALQGVDVKFFAFVGFSGKTFRLSSAHFSAVGGLALSLCSFSVPTTGMTSSIEMLKKLSQYQPQSQGPCNPLETCASLGIPAGQSGGHTSVPSCHDCLLVPFPD